MEVGWEKSKPRGIQTSQKTAERSRSLILVTMLMERSRIKMVRAGRQ